MVSAHLKNISQIGSFPQGGGGNINIWNHQLAFVHNSSQHIQYSSSRAPKRPVWDPAWQPGKIQQWGLSNQADDWSLTHLNVGKPWISSWNSWGSFKSWNFIMFIYFLQNFSEVLLLSYAWWTYLDLSGANWSPHELANMSQLDQTLKHPEIRHKRRDVKNEQTALTSIHKKWGSISKIYEESLRNHHFDKNKNKGRPVSIEMCPTLMGPY